MRVLCVTPNPSVDRIVTVPGFRAGRVFRATAVRAVCGGKGVNVARAVHRLGHEALCAGPLAGHAGRFAAEQAAAEGLAACWTVVAGETRTCLVAIHDGASTVVNEPGTAPSPADWRRFVADVARLASASDAVTISGSLPAGSAPQSIVALIDGARRAGAAPWIDTSGAALADAVAGGAGRIKVNADEAAALLGRPIGDVGDALVAARTIRERGPAAVAITLGAGGAVLVDRVGAWSAVPPDIAAVNTTGCGDSFLAGLVTLPDAAAGDALRLATAVASADALAAMAGGFDPADVARLAGEVRVERHDG